MARMVIEDFHTNEIESLEPSTMREVIKKCLWAGAKVVEKEMQNTIEAHHHVVNSYMKDSVSQGEIHEELGGAYVDVYPQGTDPRGVSNEMKNKIIILGYYSRITGRSMRKQDSYITKMRSKVAPKVLAVMNQQFNLCMDELKK